MKPEDWTNHYTRAFMVLVEGSQLGGVNHWQATTHDETFLLLLNGSPEERRYRLPGGSAVLWEQILDTMLPEGFVDHPFTRKAGGFVELDEFTLVLFRLHSGSRPAAQQTPG